MSDPAPAIDHSPRAALATIQAYTQRGTCTVCRLVHEKATAGMETQMATHQHNWRHQRRLISLRWECACGAVFEDWIAEEMNRLTARATAAEAALAISASELAEAVWAARPEYLYLEDTVPAVCTEALHVLRALAGRGAAPPQKPSDA